MNYSPVFVDESLSMSTRSAIKQILKGDDTMEVKPLLQVALDYVDKDDVLRVAALVQSYVDILDIGTLLLKKEGVQVIEKIKNAFPDKLVFADTKTLDLGQLEARMVFEAGADMMSVCGAASNATIGLAIREAHLLGKKVLIDLIGTDSSYRQIKRLSYFQPDYITIHTGIDERHTENTLFDKVEIISQISPVPLAIAGGIEVDDIPYLLVFQPAIIIVGTAITTSSHPQRIAQHFWEGIHQSLF
jgi:3-hexulose-6-phosphate synthase